MNTLGIIYLSNLYCVLITGYIDPRGLTDQLVLVHTLI